MTVNVTNEIYEPREWTTATRPADPFDGQTGFNTDVQQWEGWNGTQWVLMG